MSCGLQGTAEDLQAKNIGILELRRRDFDAEATVRFKQLGLPSRALWAFFLNGDLAARETR